MMTTKLANLLMETINKGDGEHYGNIATLEDAKKMKPIVTSDNLSYSIYALQKGDLTCLVWVQNPESKLPVIRSLKFVCW